MKERRDLVYGWVRKADSDLAAMELAVRAEVALDTACFHAQQAAEKLLKAYLIAHRITFPFTDNLPRLLTLCEGHDPAFALLLTPADLLTPYAVELRYDSTFWPSLEQAREARNAVLTIKAFIVARLPADTKTPAGEQL